MANQEHLDILMQGVDVWNKWRQEHPNMQPDLSESVLIRTDLRGVNLRRVNMCRVDLRHAYLYAADLTEANLMAANLYRTDLIGACLIGVNLTGAGINSANLYGSDFTEAKLRGANLNMANLSMANFHGADLRETILNAATLYQTDLSKADLSGAYLEYVSLVETNLKEVNLTACSVYGISTWKVQLDGAIQSNLIITPDHEPTITVDNLKVAQFIYLLLNNQEIRDVIDTIGQKGVLILGRFSQERKLVLDALREKLRTLNFLPIVFDFERPTERDFTETIMTLAGLSCFIIADITNPKSSPLELQATVPNYMIPFVPIIQEGEQPFSMFRDLKSKYNDWVLDLLVYDTSSHLIEGLERAVISPALEKRDELMAKKVEKLRMRHIGDYL